MDRSQAFQKLTHGHRYPAFCLVFPILGIELTLKWNSVTGVYGVRSIGQLIPFVTGLAGLVQAIYGIVRHVRAIQLGGFAPTRMKGLTRWQKMLPRQAESPPPLGTAPDEAREEAEPESKLLAVSEKPQSEPENKEGRAD